MMIHGTLEIICGSMFSGKSEELIRRLRRAEFAQQKIQVFKPEIDNRTTTDHIHAHSGYKLIARALAAPEQLFDYIQEDTHVIGIDEIQFFPSSIINVVIALINQNKRVIAAGLDLDFRGQPFGCMPTLMAIADSVSKLSAICMCCGKDAHFTQRLVNGNPAKFNDPLIVIGAQECYQARCRSCYKI
jgi:thymidine kinase